MFFPYSLGRAGARKRRRLITLLSVGWVSPSLPPLGACLTLGTRGPVGLVTPPRVTPPRGGVSAESGGTPRKLERHPAALFILLVRRPPAWPWPPCRRVLLGPWRPRPAGLFACGHALALPWTEPALGLLPDGLDGCGELCQAQVQGSTTWGRRPGGPGPFAQGTPGLGLPSFGHAPLRPARPTGRFRGCAPPIMQERSRVLQACEVPQCRPGGHRHGARATAQGREGLAP